MSWGECQFIPKHPVSHSLRVRGRGRESGMDPGDWSRRGTVTGSAMESVLTFLERLYIDVFIAPNDSHCPLSRP